MEPPADIQPLVTCVIADDHTLMRTGLQLRLAAISWVRVTGEASNGISALAMIRELAPHIAVLDQTMPGLTGIDIARIITEEGLPTLVILHSSVTEPTRIREALDVGVAGYMTKGAPFIEAAIRCALEGGKHIDPSLPKLHA